MFCQNCGSQLEDTAKFCGSCGSPVNGGATPNLVKEKLPDTEVLLEVKPKFKFLYFTFSSIVASVIITLVSTIATAGIDNGALFGFLSGLMISAIIMICSSVSALFKWLQIKNMSYKFYRTKIEYSDSFLNKAEKEVKYKHIRETVLSRTIVDRIFGYGRVVLFTNAETGYGNGIFIPYLTDSDSVYKEIKSLLENNK